MGNQCGGELATLFVDPSVTWSQLTSVMEPHLRDRTERRPVSLSTFPDGAYGLSKACLNAYTMIVAREHPNLSVNACTPGFCATDMGAKPPETGAAVVVHLMCAKLEGNGMFYGSDGRRSPLDRYRSPAPVFTERAKL